jgi:hypothetical protein
MGSSVLPWLVGGAAAAAAVYFGTRARRAGAEPDADTRNASLRYRPVGESGEPYPDEAQADGSTEIVYVGQSSTGRLYQTLTRHLQSWRRAKRFWSGQFTGSQSHDPGLTYDRARISVAVRVVPAARALDEEARLIARLRPRDNLIGQPPDAEADEAVPF